MNGSMPPAGWYPDQQSPQLLRYWDGVRWTEFSHVARPGVVVGNPGAPIVTHVSAIPWWQTWFAIVPGLLLCLPVGLIGLWRRAGTTSVVKTWVTVASVAFLGVALLTPDGSHSPSSESPSEASSQTPTETSSPNQPSEPAGPEMAKVPSIAGDALADARRELRTAGLRVGRISRQPSARAAGTVLRQGLKKGTALAPGSVVPLVVAVPFPRVPTVVGDGESSAVQQLRTAGYRVETSVETRTSGKDGVVLNQGPVGGSRAKANSIVHIVIANVVRPVASVPTNCTDGYEPCLPPADDYDCEGGSGNGPAYTGFVHVTGSDPYDLDADGDGVACGGD